MQIDEDPLGQVKFACLFKVTVLNFDEIMMKPEIKVIGTRPLTPVQNSVPLEYNVKH